MPSRAASNWALAARVGGPWRPPRERIRGSRNRRRTSRPSPRSAGVGNRGAIPACQPVAGAATACWPTRAFELERAARRAATTGRDDLRGNGVGAAARLRTRVRTQADSCGRSDQHPTPGAHLPVLPAHGRRQLRRHASGARARRVCARVGSCGPVESGGIDVSKGGSRAWRLTAFRAWVTSSVHQRRRRHPCRRVAVVVRRRS